jgi:spore germination cell wall hydrolase CwlJ-like protein
MATAIYYESGNQSKIGQLSVGEVILNRFKHNWANSICNIIRQPHQFTFKRKNKIIDKKYYEMAQDILNEKYHLIPNTILYFNSKRSKKFHHHKFYERIGKINFYYE